MNETTQQATVEQVKRGRGRPKKAESMRMVHIRVRILPSEKNLIYEDAKTLGTTPSKYIRKVLRNRTFSILDHDFS